MAHEGTSETGKLFCLESDLSINCKLDCISISNGIVWNARADKMFYVDSPTQQIIEFDYDLKTGSIGSPRTVIEIEKEVGTPDGMCIDAEDMLWAALWDGGRVIRINPASGEIVGEVIVPRVRKVTSCALGGCTMSTLFITTARQGFTEEDAKNEPNAGSLFAVDVDVPGVQANLFKAKR
jgi:sugar lactone lactonase YvrE